MKEIFRQFQINKIQLEFINTCINDIKSSDNRSSLYESIKFIKRSSSVSCGSLIRTIIIIDGINGQTINNIPS